MVSSNPSHTYLSTRGGSYKFSFEGAVLKGLAQDGGLFIPEQIPQFPADWRSKWQDFSFQQLAVEICSLYISPSEISREDLERIVSKSYSTFRTSDITPLKPLLPAKNLYILELFHGPTFAFKDVALQFLGNLFEYFLERRNQGKQPEESHKLTVVGATSGDTGSAAIYGLRGKKNVSVFILYPDGKISPTQEAQMTTVLDPNVHNLAVSGTFDNCQDIVKQLFADIEFNRKFNVAAVNSINWARILAQIVYYVHSYFQLQRQSKQDNPKVRYVVPTGNFGDVLAGYYAKQMGLPVDKLIISTNENDILDRFWKSGKYETKTATQEEQKGGLYKDGAMAHAGGVIATLSPAMDILVSSNFERLLWYLAFENSRQTCNEKSSHEDVQKLAGSIVKDWMTQLKASGSVDVGESVLGIARRDFSSERVTDSQTVETIRLLYKETDSSSSYVLDPHSSVGVTTALRYLEEKDDTSYICLATAHPAKFSHAVELALKESGTYSYSHIQPEEFKHLDTAEKRIERLERADKDLVKSFIQRIENH